MGSDCILLFRAFSACEFQSTLPVWGATTAGSCDPPLSRNFNPRSPCGERPADKTRFLSKKEFQSTLPVWGATSSNPDTWSNYIEFQSTLPVWGATAEGKPSREIINISIHAPRVGSDYHVPPETASTSNISIHAPRVGSDDCVRPASRVQSISIHAPRVGSDVFLLGKYCGVKISIHAPRVGSDKPCK